MPQRPHRPPQQHLESVVAERPEGAVAVRFALAVRFAPTLRFAPTPRFALALRSARACRRDLVADGGRNRQ